MAKHLPPYRTYVIHCWEESCGQSGASIHRFSLEIPATGERIGFTSSEDLIQALERAIAQIQTQVISNTPPDDES